MESASLPDRLEVPLDAALVASGARSAAAAAAAEREPARAISAAMGALYESLESVLPSVFAVAHGRLWLVAQRGYAVVPDGISIERGVMGRAARLRSGQVVADVRADPDYVEGLPGVSSEVAVPLDAGGVVVGVLNLESERPLPDGVLGLLAPLVEALVAPTDALRSVSSFDLAALARLFVYLGSLRDPDEIAALAA